MTTVRSHAQIEWTKAAFLEAKAHLTDDKGNLVAAGKSIPRDDEEAKKQLFSWVPFADVTNAPFATRRKKVNEAKDHVEELMKGGHSLEEKAVFRRSVRPAPYALGGDWDEPMKEVPQIEEEKEEEAPESPSAAIENDDDLSEVRSEEPEPEREPEREEERPEQKAEEVVVAKSKPQKKKLKTRRRVKVNVPPPPVRRYLVVNQPVSRISAKRRVPLRPVPHLPIVTRHFPKSPILENERYPQLKSNFETETHQNYGWPQADLRLR